MSLLFNGTQIKHSVSTKPHCCMQNEAWHYPAQISTPPLPVKDIFMLPKNANTCFCVNGINIHKMYAAGWTDPGNQRWLSESRISHPFLPWSSGTEISLESLNFSTILCILHGKKPKAFAVSHWETFDFINFFLSYLGRLLRHLLVYCGHLHNS